LIGVQSFRGLFKIVTIFWGALFIFDSKNKILSFVKILRINIFIVFLFSFKQILFGFSYYELAVYCPGDIRRIYSFLANPAIFSVILGIGAIDLHLKAIFEKKIKYSVLCCFYLLISSLSFHRAPLFATFFALLVISTINFRKISSSILITLNKTVFFVMIIATVIFVLLHVNLSGKYMRIRGEVINRFVELRKGIGNTDSIQTRIKQIPSTMRAISEHPFGGGLGYTELRFSNRLDSISIFRGLYASNYITRLPMGTGDNTLLTVLVELGVIGLLYFILLITWVLFSSGRSALVLKNDPEFKYLISLSFGSIVIIFISIITSSIYFSLIVGTMFWLFFALSQNIFLYDKHKS
jgi:hypothetical protein